MKNYFIKCDSYSEVDMALNYLEYKYPELHWVLGLGKPTKHRPKVLKFPMYLMVYNNELCWCDRFNLVTSKIAPKSEITIQKIINSTMKFPSNSDLMDFLI